MFYTIETDIGRSREQVVALFNDPDNLKHWQEGLVSLTHKSGEYGQPGATSDILFDMNGRKLEMLETIEVMNPPDEFTAVYTAKGVWNRNQNLFTDNSDGTTHWKQVNEFRCSGFFLKLMTVVAPGMFKKQSQKYMDAFKVFCDNSDS